MKSSMMSYWLVWGSDLVDMHKCMTALPQSVIQAVKPGSLFAPGVLSLPARRAIRPDPFWYRTKPSGDFDAPPATC